MTTKTQNEFAYYPGAVATEMCDRIDKIGDSLIQKPGKVTDENGVLNVDPNRRQDLIAWIPKEPNYEWLYLEMTEILQQLNERHWQMSINTLGKLQYSIYGPDGHFKWHRDWLAPEYHAESKGTRKVTLSVQLSDPDSYVGGYFEVAQTQDSKEPESYDVRVLDTNDLRRKLAEGVRPKGTITAFPAKFWHRVTPIYSGVRRSLVTWGLGP